MQRTRVTATDNKGNSDELDNVQHRQKCEKKETINKTFSRSKESETNTRKQNKKKMYRKLEHRKRSIVRLYE